MLWISGMLCFFHTTKNNNRPTTSPGLWRKAYQIPALSHCTKEKTWLWTEIHRKPRPNSTYLWHCDKLHGIRKKVKSVSILTTGHEKDRFTVMLVCLGDGTKLPLYVIFKRKTLPKNANFPKGVIVLCQGRGWMDQRLVQDWLIHSEPTCQHRSVARLRPWTPSPLLFQERWQVWYSPWMLQSTSHLKITWERSGRSGCWPTNTPSLQVAVSAKWNCLRFASGSARPGKTFQMNSLRSPFRKRCITNATDGTEDDQM